jgi:hypothetical protein
MIVYAVPLVAGWEISTPDVGLGVCGFCPQLRGDLAGAFVGLVDPDACAAREFGSGRFAP